MLTNTDFWAPLIGEDIATKPRGKMKYFDWVKAAEIVKFYENEFVYAGLREDWSNTSGLIWAKGIRVNPSYFFGCSNWATPIVYVENGEKEIDCWTYEQTEETSDVAQWWKKDALNEYDICLKGEEEC